MGMSIDEEGRYMNACIEYLQKNMECFGYRDYIIEQLTRYQKIEQALNSWNMNCINDREFINTIREVVEDRND